MYVCMSCLTRSSWIIIINANIYICIYLCMYVIVSHDDDCFMLFFMYIYVCICISMSLSDKVVRIILVEE